MKKIVFLLISLALVSGGFAQQKKADHLLWFTGRLIKPNVLLTPTGDTVSYNPKTRQITRVSKTGTGKKFDAMLAELNKTPRRIDAAIKEIQKTVPAPLVPAISTAVSQAFTDAEQSWKPLLNNTYTLPAGNFAIEPKKAITGKGGIHEWTEEEDEFEALLKKLRAFMAEHASDDLDGMLPVPPVYNFSYCYPCDSAAKQRYEQEKEKFISEIMAVDTDLHTEALKMCQYIQVNYQNTLDNPENEKLKKQHDEAWAFHEFVMQRGTKRAVLLLNKYKKDPYRIPAMFEFVLMADRQVQILGVREETAFAGVDYWEEVMATMDRFYLNAFKEKDYTIGLNIRTILKHERTNQLLGINKNNGLLDALLLFNQFKLNSNITAKMGNDNGYIMGHVRGDNWFHAIPDRETCRLNWILAVANIDRTAKYKLLAAELGGAPVEYVGTRDWQSQPPVFKVDFCDKEGEEIPDSVIAHTFHPEGFREKWKYPPPAGVIEVEQASGILATSFIDVERAKKEAESINQEKIDKLKKDIQTKYAGLSNGNVKNMSELSVKMQEDMEKLNREIKELIVKTNPLTYIFTPVTHNKTELIFKERLNGKEIFPENGAIEYAWFHLTMEHDPDGPHPLNAILLNRVLSF